MAICIARYHSAHRLFFSHIIISTSSFAKCLPADTTIGHSGALSQSRSTGTSPKSISQQLLPLRFFSRERVSTFEVYIQSKKISVLQASIVRHINSQVTTKVYSITATGGFPNLNPYSVLSDFTRLRRAIGETLSPHQ